MEKELTKQVAVWLLSHELAGNLQQALDFVRETESGKAGDEMVEFLNKNDQIRAELGGEVTAESALKFMQGKVNSAAKLISLWANNPKDTNAVFFFRDYKSQDWSSVK
jgi:hypothetical protein